MKFINYLLIITTL